MFKCVVFVVVKGREFEYCGEFFLEDKNVLFRDVCVLYTEKVSFEGCLYLLV